MKIKSILQYLIIGFVIIISLIIFSGCGNDSNPNDINDLVPGANQEPPSTGQKQYPVSNVNFILHIPEESSPSGPVYITILDEVTGLEFNPRFYEMGKVEDGNYKVTIPFPVGSLVKYKYLTNDGENRDEFNTNGYPIRYRLYYVDGPGEIQDHLARWQNSKFNGKIGRIFGKVADVDTGEPVSNVIVSAGGLFALTRYDGSFDLYNVPQGAHQITFLTTSGAYKPYKQIAVVGSNLATPASVSLKSQPLVEVTFTVHVPEDTVKGAPIRIAGNHWQFGYTFSDAIDGSGIMAMRMPEMQFQGNFTYSYSTMLPAGSDLHYKYTLGDGFWSSEHTLDGKFFLRQLIVPEDTEFVHVDDQVQTFDSSSSAAIWFDVNTPESTPDQDHLYIQFKLLDWMPPIPMWYGGEARWGFRYSSPTNITGNLEYRYCRNGICGDSISIAVEKSLPRYAQTNQPELQAYTDIVESWFFLDHYDFSPEPLPAIIERSSDFITGVQLIPDYSPEWNSFGSQSIDTISALNANTIFFTPTWTYYDLQMPYLGLVPGSDILDKDLENLIEGSRKKGVSPVLYPQPDHRTDFDSWWIGMPRNELWWDLFFEHYKNFLMHYAEFAEENGVTSFLIGGEWLLPALPNGTLGNGEASGAPANAFSRWNNIMAKIRSVYSGHIGWLQPHDFTGINPAFLSLFDEIHYSWYAGISQDQNISSDEIKEVLREQLNSSILPTYNNSGIPVVLHINYPSAVGALNGCVEGNNETCLKPTQLRPGQIYPETVVLDLENQAKIYSAFFELVNETFWISGIVSDDYFPPMALTDFSANIHGKPAEIILSVWFEAFNNFSH